MTDTKRILVIEDTPQFAAVAREVYDSDKLIQAEFATDFEEAEERILRGGLDAVVTDLFFPSRADHRRKFLDEVKETFQEYEAGVDKGFPSHMTNERLQEFGALSENPSGLTIAQICIARGIPFKIVSQGDRHRGDYATVRQALKYHKVFSRDFIHLDPIYCDFYRNGNEVDKNLATTWREVLYGNPGEYTEGIFSQ